MDRFSNNHTISHSYNSTSSTMSTTTTFTNIDNSIRTGMSLYQQTVPLHDYYHQQSGFGAQIDAYGRNLATSAAAAAATATSTTSTSTIAMTTLPQNSMMLMPLPTPFDHTPRKVSTGSSINMDSSNNASNNNENMNDLSISIPTSPDQTQRLRDLYATSARCESVRSYTTTTTHSVRTEPISNTADSRIQKKRKHSGFLKLTHVLLKLLERKDKKMHAKAKAVIDDCNSRKRMNEPGYESIGESIRAPLKQIVNPTFWKEAKKVVGKRPSNKSTTSSCWSRRYSSEAKMALEPLDGSSSSSSYMPNPAKTVNETVLSLDGHTEQSLDDATDANTIHNRSSSPSSTQQDHHSSVVVVKDEKACKLSKKRFWMLVRVLMMYLEQKDNALYLKAKQTIKDCALFHAQQQPGYKSRSGSTRFRLRELIDSVYWTRAECYLGHVLAKEDSRQSRRKRSVSQWNQHHSESPKQEHSPKSLRWEYPIPPTSHHSNVMEPVEINANIDPLPYQPNSSKYDPILLDANLSMPTLPMEPTAYFHLEPNYQGSPYCRQDVADFGQRALKRVRY